MGLSESLIAEQRRSWRNLVLPDLRAPALTVETGVVAFAIGIALYFALPLEPSWLLAGFAVIALGAAPRIVSERLRTAAVLLAMLVAGVFWATVQTSRADPEPVKFEQRMTIQGWISDIDRGGSMRRLIIDVSKSSAEVQPERVRIRVGRNFPDFDVGEGIRVDAVIGPLPGPVVPDGYDPGRRAYFDGLSGTGFAIADGQSARIELNAWEMFRARLARLRHGIAARVLAAAPENTAGLQAALLTGIRDHIPDDQTDSLRASGLAHILAISGLHMGMVALGIYAVASAALASVERLSRGRDVRKIAAVIGILSATAYLALSGASVATQRAYIMVTIGFLALILNRRVVSLRSVAVAALITLLIRPEALTSVGFQMSFAAVASMVVIFRAWQDRWPAQRPQGLRDRIRKFYGSLFGTSLVAGLATGVFALLHFGRIATYGLAANMAAMTVFPAVMAIGILSLLLMPFGGEGVPLYTMSRLIAFMLAVSDWVSSWPGAVGTVRASPAWVIALYGLGFALSCLGSRRSLALGLACMGVAVAGWMRAPVYDLRISESGRVSLLIDGVGQTSSLRADRYGRERFSQAAGEKVERWADFRDDFADCDALGCRFTAKGTIVSVLEAASEVPEACEDSDLVIVPQADAGPVARRGCRVPLVDGAVLRRTQGIHVRTGENLHLQPVRSEARSRRPWGGG